MMPPAGVMPMLVSMRLSVAYRGDARAVAEVREDRAPGLPSAELRDQIFVREAVKAVAAHALIVQRARQRKAPRDLGQPRDGTRCRSRPPAAGAESARRPPRSPAARSAGAAARAAPSRAAWRAASGSSARAARAAGRRARSGAPPRRACSRSAAKAASIRSAIRSSGPLRSIVPAARRSSSSEKSAYFSDEEPTLSARTLTTTSSRGSPAGPRSARACTRDASPASPRTTR